MVGSLGYLLLYPSVETYNRLFFSVPGQSSDLTVSNVKTCLIASLGKKFTLASGEIFKKILFDPADNFSKHGINVTPNKEGILKHVIFSIKTV